MKHKDFPNYDRTDTDPYEKGHRMMVLGVHHWNYFPNGSQFVKSIVEMVCESHGWSLALVLSG